ncbi:uncharacterized protein LOC106673076 isoform X2 [Cimex lectularius]|uniref:Uncharacterized protein n=1 Tax=Cimex lectularius TaxID=79782 RepID=A0A8I6SB47_CIMLE|nr:uncharacterized protein LOC106673076 isoform X2 [Cimex lectularius]
MRATSSNSSLYKERLNDPKYHILSDKAISLSTLSWNNSSHGRGSNHSVPPTRNSYDSTSVKIRHTPRDYYQLLLDFPSSVSLEAFRMGRRETTDETLKSVLRKALHKTKPGEKEVCINGERFDVCRLLELLRKMSYFKQKLFLQKLESQLIIKPKVVGVSEDEEPHYNKLWKKCVKPMPNIETAISYNVRGGKPEFIEKCISTESLPTPELSNNFEAPNRVEMSRIPDKIFEEDPMNYFKARKRLQAPYQLKAEPIQSFHNLTNKEVQIVQNMWSSIKRNTETLATTIIINCYRLKENIVKKRVSINKILKHKQLMKHGRLGMAFLSQVVNHLTKQDEGNQLVHKAGMLHQN